MSARRPRVLLVSAEPVDERPTGVAIRTLELARVLGAHADVTIAGVEPSCQRADGPPVISYRLFGEHRRGSLAQHIDRADAIVAQPPWPALARRMRRSGARLIYDLYDPEPLEVVERLRAANPLLRRVAHTLTIDRVLEGLASADHVMCASEKQRDLWLGAMLAERMLSPGEHDRDATMRSRLDCVPFGLPAEPPVRHGQGVRERFPQIAPDDEVVLWNGGIWAWLDAPCAIRAIALLRERRPRARLVFMGAASLPAAVAATLQARELAQSLGLLDKHVFFNDGWVPYERRADWLLSANCVLSTQADHLESRFAFRTRILDALWAGLPIVCSAGDELAEIVDREDLGEVVAPADPAALAAATERVLERGRDDFAARLAIAAARHTWERAAAPLVDWIAREGAAPVRRAHRRPGRPAQRLRSGAFDATVCALNAVGIEHLPSV